MSDKKYVSDNEDEDEGNLHDVLGRDLGAWLDDEGDDDDDDDGGLDEEFVFGPPNARSSSSSSSSSAAAPPVGPVVSRSQTAIVQGGFEAAVRQSGDMIVKDRSERRSVLPPSKPVKKEKKDESSSSASGMMAEINNDAASALFFVYRQIHREISIKWKESAASVAADPVTSTGLNNAFEVRSSVHESMLLISGGKNIPSLLRGNQRIEVCTPICCAGPMCIGLRGGIAGFTEDERGSVLMAYMSVAELRQFLTTGETPANISTRFCVLCTRYAITSFLGVRAAQGASVPHIPFSTIPYGNKCGIPGEYREDKCHQVSAGGYTVQCPVAMYDKRSLLALKTNIPGLWVISQDAMCLDPLPTRVAFRDLPIGVQTSVSQAPVSSSSSASSASSSSSTAAFLSSVASRRNFQ